MNQRVELFTAPHKALRYLVSNLLLAMGGATFEDPRDVEAITTELSATLWACEDHIAHEDRHVLPMLAERAPETLATLDDEHDQHRDQIAELRALARSLGDAKDASERAAFGRTLYLHFSVFVAETLAHMAHEERVVGPLLERLFSREELLALHLRIVGSIPPPDMIVWLRAMIPASNRAERFGLLGEVQANAPSALPALLADAKSVLRNDEWADLAGRFGAENEPVAALPQF